MPDKKPPVANRFQPGVSGNPKGRPVGASLKSQIQTLFIEMMDEKVKIRKKDVQFLTAWKAEFMRSALAGGWAAKVLTERLFSENILESIDKSLNKSLREDEDFQQYRIMKQGHNFQQKILLDKTRKIYAMAGRRAGKTEGNILKVLSVAIQDNHNAAIICLTQETAMKLYWKGIEDGLNGLGYAIESANRMEGLFTLGNGSIISLKGNNSITDREKFRGFSWDLVVIDEVQSQHSLPYLINDILEPTLIDRGGTLILTGTGPRVRGTYWEELWTNDKGASKYNWNLTQNPYIKNHEKVLDQIKADKGLTDASPLYQREYLGQVVYDDDAQVYRLDENNFYTDEQMVAWINSQPRSDIMFAAGLDYGFSDSDAFVIVMFSKSSHEKFLVYEHKGNRKGVTELADKCKDGLNYIQTNAYFASIPDRSCYIYADGGGGGKKISYELMTQFNLPCLDAYKVNKDMAIELLQEETRRGHFKVRAGSAFADESLKTVFARNEKDELIRTIDDDTYHPDMIDSILYAFRTYWTNHMPRRD